MVPPARERRWELALAIERDARIAVCDTDPFKAHHARTCWEAGLAPFGEWQLASALAPARQAGAVMERVTEDPRRALRRLPPDRWKYELLGPLGLAVYLTDMGRLEPWDDTFLPGQRLAAVAAA